MDVKSADKRPEKYVGPDGKPRVRMVPADNQVIKKESAVDEVSLSAIKKAVQGSGLSNVKKAMPTDKLKKDLAKMKLKLATEGTLSEATDMNKLKQLAAAGLVQKTDVQKLLRVFAKMESGKTVTPAEREMLLSVLSDLTALITGDMSMLQKAKKAVKEDVELNEGKAKASMSEATDDDYHKTLGPTKNSDEGIAALKKKHGMTHDQAKATIKRLMGESKELDEVLDRPGALDSYRKKADDSGNKARNSATRKILTAPKDGKRPDHSDELKTMRKRNKGQDMADRVAARQFRKSIGRPYIKKEEVEFDEGILKPYHAAARQPWSKTVKDSKGTAGEHKQISKGKDFTVWTAYRGSNKSQPHYVVRDDKVIGSGMTHNSALKDAGLKDKDVTHRSKFAAGSILNKGMKEEYVNEKLKVSDGMGAWVSDFQKSDAPQFKGKSDKERRDMAIAAFLSAKRGAKGEGYVSMAQQRAVWATRKDGGKGHPDNKGKK